MPSADPRAVVEAYQTLLQMTHEMRDAAQRQEWETLIARESDYVLQAEHIRQLDRQTSLPSEHQQDKAVLLEEILENDLDIRQRLIARRDELGELIGTSVRQRNLSRAYGVKGATRLHDHQASDNTRAP